MACDVEVQDAPAIMANNEEAVENTEGDRRNVEEIHGGDGFAMIAEKSQPPPTRFWIYTAKRGIPILIHGKGGKERLVPGRQVS